MTLYSDHLNEAVDYLKTRLPMKLSVGIILGSGLSDSIDSINDKLVIPFSEIPWWPISTVKGHSGEIITGEVENTKTLILNGRVHYYEGYRMEDVTFPIRIMQLLGIKNLVVTNAAGAVNPEFEPGDVMVITDHVNLTGDNPLRGKNLEQFGVRFPDMSQAYNREMIRTAQSIASELDFNLREGVYAGLTGPSFETPAELRFLKLLGVDAVGMSTVPEVIVARHGNMNVLGLSGISNKANLDGSTITTHEEVLEAGKTLSPKIGKLIMKFIENLNI